MKGAVLLFLTTVLSVNAVNVTLLDITDLKATLEENPNGGLTLELTRKGESEVLSVIGKRAGAVVSIIQDGGVLIQFANNITLNVTTEKVTNKSGQLIKLTWDGPRDRSLEDCINLNGANWYGGPQQKRQLWPIEKLVLQEYSYITKEADNCAVTERYWLNSKGIFFYFDNKVPLFVDQNASERNASCFKATVKAPYSNQREKNELTYVIAIFDDVKQAHEFAVSQYLGKPTGIPDERMIQYPVWSTWAKYKRDIDHDIVLEFADEILSHGFPNSHFELDDLWEICYGSQTVDVNRFPNMTDTVSKLKERGFRVTVWTHPFINKGCEPWYSDAMNISYLVTRENGTVETSWWNDNGTTTAYLDFTKPEVRSWYANRLKKLQEDYGIDSYKFDAGESSWSPQIPILQGDIREQPELITSDYVREVAKFGPLVEVRSGARTQDLPIFVRMVDKDTYWTFENGLPTLITTLLQMNMNGYPLVLPDMIGGNGYNEPPSKELFIRWLQANVFMPSLQFSYVPWDFDNETISISLRYVSLHANYTERIVSAMERAVTDGSPVNPPIWWIAPNDVTAHAIWDEFLLGDDILVAPVVEQGAVSRDIYLPAGRWLEGGTVQVHNGPIWLRNHSAPLDSLPYFLLQGEPDSATTALLSVTLVLIGLMFSWIL